MANEDLPRDPHLSALHRANGESRPRVPDEVRAAVLRAAHAAVRPAAANDEATNPAGAAAKPLRGHRAQSRFAVAAVLVLAIGMGWQLIHTTAPPPDSAVTGEETVTASMVLGQPAPGAPPPAVDVPPVAPAETAAPMVAQAMSPAMDEAATREAPAPPPAAPPAVALPQLADAAPASAMAGPVAAKAAPAPAAGAMAEAATRNSAAADPALPTVVPVLVAPPARRYKSPQAWWAEIEALRKTDAAAAARETAAFKRVYPRWPDDPTPAAPTDNR